MEQRLSLISISISISILLLSLLYAFCSSANGRKDSRDYWKGIMKDEPIPAALEVALTLPNSNPNPNPTTSSQSILKNPNCRHDADPTATSSSSGNPASATHDLEAEEICLLPKVSNRGLTSPLTAADLRGCSRISPPAM